MNKIISFITAFKKFVGLQETIQKAAVYSWKINGICAAATLNDAEPDFNFSNVTILDGVRRSSISQAPSLRGLIEKALSTVRTPMIGLISSDIMLLEDFSEKFEKMVQKYGYDIFLTGSRFNIRVVCPVDNPEGYQKIISEPRMASDTFDLFITSKFMWRKILKAMPDFMTSGRCWDDWLCTYADINILKKLSCTDQLVTLHCGHPILDEDPHNKAFWNSDSTLLKIKDWEPARI